MQTLLPEHQVKDLHSEHAPVDIVLFQPDDIIVVKGQIVFIREDSIQIGLAQYGLYQEHSIPDGSSVEVQDNHEVLLG